MYQRISSWSGLGFLSSLKRFWSFFGNRIKHYDFSKDSVLVRRDFTDKVLANYMVNKPAIVDALEDYFPPETPFLEEHQGFQALIAAAKSAEGPLYTKETAPQFHRLIFATLIMLGSLLGRLRVMFSKNNESDVEILEDKKRQFFLVKGITKLLYFILHPSAFKHHIRIITANRYDICLLTDYDEKEDIYLNFAYDHTIRRKPDDRDNKVSYDSPNDDPGVATLRTLASVCKFV